MITAIRVDLASKRGEESQAYEALDAFQAPQASQPPLAHKAPAGWYVAISIMFNTFFIGKLIKFARLTTPTPYCDPPVSSVNGNLSLSIGHIEDKMTSKRRLTLKYVVLKERMRK